LAALDETGAIPSSEVASKIAMLCKWNVAVTVLVRYQVAVLPDALSTTRNVREGIEILQRSTLCYAMFCGLWDPKKPYIELLKHAGALLRELCKETRNRIESVAALIGLWFGRVRLHKDSPIPASKNIVFLVFQAAFMDPPLDSETTYRLWSVFLSLIEIEHGERMDEAKEREAIILAGQMAANFDHTKSLHGDKSLKQRLGCGFTEGASYSDTFIKGYSDEYLQLLREQSKKS
jgi:hypothetical protein